MSASDPQGLLEAQLELSSALRNVQCHSRAVPRGTMTASLLRAGDNKSHLAIASD